MSCKSASTCVLHQASTSPPQFFCMYDITLSDICAFAVLTAFVSATCCASFVQRSVRLMLSTKVCCVAFVAASIAFSAAVSNSFAFAFLTFYDTRVFNFSKSQDISPLASAHTAPIATFIISVCQSIFATSF